MSNLNIFSGLDDHVLDDFYKELWQRLVPNSGDCESMQGEMIRALGRFDHEYFTNLNMNWLSEKFYVNQDMYPAGYLSDFEEDEDFIPDDIAKCKATADQVKNASHYDELLNKIKDWLARNPLPEWDANHQAKIQYALERARPKVPVGVISHNHWISVADSKKKSDPEWYAEYKASEWHEDSKYETFARKQILYWIFCNPELVDNNNNPLNESVADILETLEGHNPTKEMLPDQANISEVETDDADDERLNGEGKDGKNSYPQACMCIFLTTFGDGQLVDEEVAVYDVVAEALTEAFFGISDPEDVANQCREIVIANFSEHEPIPINLVLEYAEELAGRLTDQTLQEIVADLSRVVAKQVGRDENEMVVLNTYLDVWGIDWDDVFELI